MRQLEHLEQVGVIEWADIAVHQYPQLRNLFAIPNGGHRHLSVAIKLKAEGVRAGVPDLMLAWPMGGYHGLFIEMKSAKGRVSEAQKEWIESLLDAGYCCCVAHFAEEAIADILEYLMGG